jgi:hypothetical protein
MLRRVTVQCVIFLSFPAVAEARKTRAAMINCDDAAVKASAAQLAQTAPSPPKRVTAASHPAPVLPQAPLQLMAQQPVRQQPANRFKPPRRRGRVGRKCRLRASR